MKGDDKGKKWKGHQGTFIKGPWTITKGSRIECGRWGCVGWGEVVVANGDNCTSTTIKYI